MATNTKLIPIMSLEVERPDWPFGVWWTGKLIRDGKLGSVKLGRRVFVTDEIIETFYRRHLHSVDDTAAFEDRRAELAAIAGAHGGAPIAETPRAAKRG